MGKDPAFLFYPGDWLGGTMNFTREEKGAYMDLLMLQFNNGHMTYHMIERMLGQDAVKFWTDESIKSKFIQDAEGKWYNERLELEKIKRQNFVKSRKNNMEGKNQYKNKGSSEGRSYGGHMTSHMENRNRNENKDNNISNSEEEEILPKPTLEEVVSFFTEQGHPKSWGEKFFYYYDAQDWMTSANNSQPIRNWKSKANEWLLNPGRFQQLLEMNDGRNRKTNSASGANSKGFNDIDLGGSKYRYE